MLDFRSAILQNIKNAEVILMKLCEVSSMDVLPIILWDNTYDNFNCHESNYSFLTEPKIDYITTSKLFNDHRKIDLWINDDDTFNLPYITRFKREVKSFLEILLCLVHITGGQPSHYSVRVWVNILWETLGKYSIKVTKTQNARISKRVNIL
jgi:hypothetical protein